MKKFLSLSRSLLLYITVFLFASSFLIPAAPTEAFAAEKQSGITNPFPLILDSDSVDYMSYIPELKSSKSVKKALTFKNPDISIDAASAILLSSKDIVLYRKNAVKPVFPGSTSKLLAALVAVEWCKLDETVKVGNEVSMITDDASVAGLEKGEKLTVYSLLSAMLLPSGNDAAYVMAAYVGRKSLNQATAKSAAAIKEFVRLMNEKAEKLGAENSCFITPDGYDAIGQYTTAYDMGRIGLAAVKSKKILSITGKSCRTVKLLSGETLSWQNTNQLINKNSTWYNSKVIGLKTGTTEMAGRCLISAAKSSKGIVISVVMNSTSEGRWRDSNKLLNYGLKQLP